MFYYQEKKPNYGIERINNCQRLYKKYDNSCDLKEISKLSTDVISSVIK
jgi:hypothetical protein